MTFCDDAEYRFFVAPGAMLRASLFEGMAPAKRTLRLWGNRPGILSLANVLLAFQGNAGDREFMALTGLPFVEVDDQLSVIVRLTDGEATGHHGFVSSTDQVKQLEWAIADGDLQQVSLWVHRIAADPAQEYARLLLTDESVVDIEVRLIERDAWMETGPPWVRNK